MSGRVGTIGLSIALCSMTVVTGCASKEMAAVSFSYVVEPKEKGLPPGMKTVAIMPAKVGETTDPKWQELSTTVLASLINESRSKFGTDVTVTERRDAKAVFDEGDMKAAGMATGKGGDRIYLLKPVPEPRAVALSLSAVFCLSFFLRVRHLRPRG